MRGHGARRKPIRCPCARQLSCTVVPLSCVRVASFEPRPRQKGSLARSRSVADDAAEAARARVDEIHRRRAQRALAEDRRQRQRSTDDGRVLVSSSSVASQPAGQRSLHREKRAVARCWPPALRSAAGFPSHRVSMAMTVRRGTRDRSGCPSSRRRRNDFSASYGATCA